MYLFNVTFLIAYYKKTHILIIDIMDIITLFITSIIWYIILTTFIIIIIMFYINSIY